MKERIKSLLENALPVVNFDADCLYDELDSLGVTITMMVLSEEYGIELSSRDATPKNLFTLDAIVAMVQKKLAEKNA